MSKKTEERKTLTNKIAAKIAPNEVKPTQKLENELKAKKQSQMKTKLLLNEDEDSDEEGKTFKNPVAL